MCDVTHVSNKLGSYLGIYLVTVWFDEKSGMKIHKNPYCVMCSRHPTQAIESISFEYLLGHGDFYARVEKNSHRTIIF